MSHQSIRRWFLVLAVGPTAGFFSACSAPDNPKIAEAPPPAKEENPKPPMAGNKKLEFMNNDRYKKAMERAGKAGSQ